MPIWMVQNDERYQIRTGEENEEKMDVCRYCRSDCFCYEDEDKLLPDDIEIIRRGCEKMNVHFSQSFSYDPLVPSVVFHDTEHSLCLDRPVHP